MIVSEMLRVVIPRAYRAIIFCESGVDVLLPLLHNLRFEGGVSVLWNIDRDAAGAAHDFL